jgi:hypothetical protein
MKKPFAVIIVLFAAMLTPAFADGIKRERVKFEPGASETTLEARIKGDDSFEYTLGAKAGQVMTITFKADNRFAFFNLLPPGGEGALFVGSGVADPGSYTGTLPADGDYVVQVYLMRNAARRNEVANYTITIGIGASAGSAEPQGDFADGLLGGPDFWVVSGVAADDELNIRKGASTKDAIVKGVPNGAILRNKGCKMVDGQRWCAVEDRYDPAVAGWVAGRYLREAGAETQENASSDTLVPGTNYHATGRIPCTLDGQPDVQDCEFGVTRGAPGVATVFITVSNGFVRVLSFDNGKVAPQSAVTSFSSSRDQDNTIVKVNGQDEAYVIPDAVIFGG